MGKQKLDSESWARLNRLLDEALDLAPADRAAWLDRLDPEMHTLKPQLCDLLSRATQVETADFLAKLPKMSAALNDDTDGTPGVSRPASLARRSGLIVCCASSAAAAWVRFGWQSGSTVFLRARLR